MASFAKKRYSWTYRIGWFAELYYVQNRPKQAESGDITVVIQPKIGAYVNLTNSRNLA